MGMDVLLKNKDINLMRQALVAPFSLIPLCNFFSFFFFLFFYWCPVLRWQMLVASFSLQYALHTPCYVTLIYKLLHAVQTRDRAIQLAIQGNYLPLAFICFFYTTLQQSPNLTQLSRSSNNFNSLALLSCIVSYNIAILNTYIKKIHA